MEAIMIWHFDNILLTKSNNRRNWGGRVSKKNTLYLKIVKIVLKPFVLISPKFEIACHVGLSV